MLGEIKFCYKCGSKLKTTWRGLKLYGVCRRCPHEVEIGKLILINDEGGICERENQIKEQGLEKIFGVYQA